MDEHYLERLETCIYQLYECMQQDIALHFQGQDVPKDFLGTYFNAIDRIVAHHPQLREYSIRSSMQVLLETRKACARMKER